MSHTQAYAVVGLRVDPEKLKKLFPTDAFDSVHRMLFGYMLFRRGDALDYEFLAGAVLSDGEAGIDPDNPLNSLTGMCLENLLQTLHDEMRGKLQPYGLWDEGKFGVHVILYTYKEGPCPGKEDSG